MITQVELPLDPFDSTQVFDSEIAQTRGACGDDNFRGWKK